MAVLVYLDADADIKVSVDDYYDKTNSTNVVSNEVAVKLGKELIRLGTQDYSEALEEAKNGRLR